VALKWINLPYPRALFYSICKREMKARKRREGERRERGRKERGDPENPNPALNRPSPPAKEKERMKKKEDVFI